MNNETWGIKTLCYLTYTAKKMYLCKRNIERFRQYNSFIIKQILTIVLLTTDYKQI